MTYSVVTEPISQIQSAIPSQSRPIENRSSVRFVYISWPIRKPDSKMAPNADKKQPAQQNSSSCPVSNTSEAMKPFKQRRSFEHRRQEVENIRKKFPTKIPVVVERYQREVNLPVMDKTKFLVPQELTIMNFAIIIKNRLRVPTSRAFYFVINNQSIASTSKTVAEIYKEHKDEDGFLYMTYASQEMFGSGGAQTVVDW